MRSNTAASWPILKRYDQKHLAQIALPLGGIGTGTVSLSGIGGLRDWEIVNRPAKGFTPIGYSAPFFALWTKPAGGPAVTRALLGPLELADYEGGQGSPVNNHGLPRFRQCTFAAAYPLGQVFLRDDDVPLDVRLEAFNPLIPGDAEASGIPVAVLRYVLKNRSPKPVVAAVCGSIPNFVGMDGFAVARDWQQRDIPIGARANRNSFRQGSGYCGLFMESQGVDPKAEQFGSLALACLTTKGVTYRENWAKLSWGNALLDFWDDFSDDGALDPRTAEGIDVPMGSLAVKLRIPPRATRSVTFLLTWHFPNRMTWTPTKPEAGGTACCEGGACADPNRIGNYYTTRYRDAWDAAGKTAAALPDLEARTVQFVRAFSTCDLPEVVKEAALFNVSSLRTQTAFRTEDGRLFGWEGCGDKVGCCHGSCTHVWNYEQTTAFLFGDLAVAMREVEFAQAVDDVGLMTFRVNLPIARAREWSRAAADGQMGCIMKMYRDWQLSGDDTVLRTLWPKVRKALEFCWVPGGWDADRDGVMEGCQHNTMDVEYYGPNPQMGVWYLGALRAGEEMARYVGEKDFAATCHDLFTRGSQWIDANLFNGEYYEQQIRPPLDESAIAPGLVIGMGTVNLKEPEQQLGPGCLVDQLVGQYMAHVCGLGYLLDPTHVRTTLQSIVKHNFKTGFHGHFNHMRSFVLGDEAALLMATYPRGRPARPFPYFTEVMTGFEYSTAVHMIYEGQTAPGMKCIKAIRDRYDGRKRSPFNEAECGHHYARAMAAWAAVLALTGFAYSGVTQTMTFAPRNGLWFWSNGRAWGTCRLRVSKPGVRVELSVLHGTLALRTLVLAGVGQADLGGSKAIGAGKNLSLNVRKQP